MVICPVCEKQNQVIATRTKLDWVKEDCCYDCEDFGYFDEWIGIHYPQQVKTVPICSCCSKPILERDGWTRSKCGRFKLHDKCRESVYEYVVCSGCGGKALKRSYKQQCLTCRAGETSKTLFGESLSEMAEKNYVVMTNGSLMGTKYNAK